MTLTPEGGAAIPVSVTTTRKVQGGAAIPVYGYMTAPTDGRPAMGGSAIPVRVLTAADLKQNGGQWTLEGRPHAMPVYTAPATTTVMGGPALAVYPVNAWPTVPVAPAWAPTDIAGLQLWLKADTGLFKDAAKAQPVTADADAVYTWADQSGNSKDVVQATAGARPLYKVNIQNGKPVVRFDGSDDILVAGTTITTSTISVFIVAARNFVTDGYRFLVATQKWLIQDRSLSVDVVGHGIDAYEGADVCSNLDTTNNTFALLEVLGTNFDNIDFYLNAGSGVNKTTGSAFANEGGTAVGGRAAGLQYYTGDIGEILIYDSVLSATNRAKVETYLNGRWAVY